MTRIIFGVLAGVITAFLVITVSQVVSLSMHPFPEGLDTENAEAMNAYISSLPGSAFAMVLGGYAIAAFLGGLIATLIARAKFVPALIIGGFLTLASIANAKMIAQPLWVSVVSVVVMIPAACLGAKMVKLKA